jgi:transposase
MLKVITAAKKKNDRADAERIADLLRVDLLPECYMLPEEIRELRRILRYRNHIVRTAVKMQNKMAGLLIEVGVPYSKKRNKHLQTMLIEAAKLARTGTGNWLSCMNGSYQRGIETGLC